MATTKKRINEPGGFVIPTGATESNVITAEELDEVRSLVIHTPAALTGVLGLQSKYGGSTFVPVESPIGTAIVPTAAIAFPLTESPFDGLRLVSGSAEAYQRNFPIVGYIDGPKASSVLGARGPKFPDISVELMGGWWDPRFQPGEPTTLIDQLGVNNGSFVGSPRIVNGVIEFSSDLDQIDLGGAADASYADITDGLTLIVIVRPTAADFDGGDNTIFSKVASAGAATEAYRIDLRDTASDGTYQFVWSRTTGPAIQTLQAAPDGLAVADKLTAVYATHSNGDQKIYVDGVQKGTAAVADTILSVDTNAPLRLGARNATPTGGLEAGGEVHFAAILNRQMGATEIAAVHAALKTVFTELD